MTGHYDKNKKYYSDVEIVTMILPILLLLLLLILILINTNDDNIRNNTNYSILIRKLEAVSPGTGREG